MKKQHYFIIYTVSLVFFFAIAHLQKTPGYMDASYYYATGRQLAMGEGATEPFIWNYLNNPQTTPTPAFTYWMPLSALLAALGMWVGGTDSFLAARVPFVLLAALIPCLAVYFVSRVTERKVYYALAAAFGLLCGAYLPYLTLTESFTPFFVLGAVFLLIAGRVLEAANINKNEWLHFLLLGVLAGLMHLTRADGILWLASGVVVLTFAWFPKRKTAGSTKMWMFNLLLLLAGYLLMMSGWFIRNFVLFGSVFPEGSNLAMRFTRYDDLFMSPASSLTFARMIETGISSILMVRARAGLTNLETLFGVASSVVLLPFMVIGAWNQRKNRLTKIVLIMIAMLFLLMTLIFPFAGYRGGFFHSISAFQIYLWVLAIIGIEVVVHWSVCKLKWVEPKARTLFAVVLIFGVAGMTCISYFNKVQPLTGAWDQSYTDYRLLAEELTRISGRAEFRVMINDTPGYFSATNNEAIQLSSGNVQDVSGLLDRFDIDYLVVDEDVPESLRSLYDVPGDQSGFHLVEEFGNYLIYNRQ
jgi:hypothetical protein